MMLQRAASNAYSWWWASHIRTKQSKWLEQNLQDMEEKVAYTLKLIEEDGDSFAKRAEMYYKKRPELISFVEESYRAYRALAERYDHISTELQNANNTIASVFPEQVPYSIDDDDEETPRMQSRTAGMTPKGNIPKVPKIPAKDMRSFLSSPSKKLRPSKSTKKPKTASVVKSGLSQPKGLEEIDKLQKQILALQTEKEFVKSAYESRMEKYWEIENQMREVQEKVYNLQDEFGTGIGIESDDARTLMAASALKSCQETLTELQVKQERSADEVKMERQRINNAREKLESLKDEFLSGEAIQKKPPNKDGDSLKQMKQVLEDKSAENKLELLQQKIESIESLSVTEMAEKIDEVVNQVVSLENEVLSQSTLIQRLRRENDELQSQIRSLEDDTATLVNGKNDLSNKVAELEGKLHGLQDFSQTVEEKNNNLQTNFTEAKSSLSQLSDKLQYVKPDEEVDGSSHKEEKPQDEAKLPKDIAGQEGAAKTNDGIKQLQSENSIRRVEATQSTKTDKSDEEPKVSNSIQKEEKPTTELKSIEESVKQENKQNHGDDKVKVVDIAIANANDSIPAEKKEPATPLQKSEERIEQDNLDYGKEKSKEQEANSVDNNDVSEETKGVNRETKDDTKHHVHFASPRSRGEVDNQPGCNIEDTSGEEDINNMLSVGRNEDATEEKADEPNWKEMFMKGMEDKEKILLTEYTAILRNYKELKRKISDSSEANTEINNDSSDVALQLKELKIANAKKDEEIKSLLQKLGNLQTCFGDNNNVEAQLTEKRETMAETSRTESTESEINARLIQVVEQNLSTSPVEEKFRMSIDELLEENLDFWLRFSTSFHQVQKFETEVKDLQAEVTKLEEKHKKQEGSNSMKYSLRSDGRPLFRHLREIQTELSVWMEKCALLKEELKSRFSSLCSIQEEITMALKVSAEDDDFTFTSYQAAKFQGEVLNMKQENNKVADELQAGLDHVTNLQLEVEKSLNILSEKFGLSTDASKGHLEHSSSKSRVPLQSFIFGPKPKKKSSFFSCVHPALHRKYNGLRSGLK